MNKKNLLILTLMTGAALSVWAAPTAQGQVPGLLDMVEMDLGEAVNDSIAEARRAEAEARRIEGMVRPAEASYAKVRTMRFDGFNEGDFYPEAYECYRANATVIDSLPGHERFAVSRAVLLDIYKDLLDGAYYYSGRGDKARMNLFAQAYLDIQDLPCMEGEKFFRDPRSFPTIAYNAASGAYNAREFERAIRYFDTFLSTGSEVQRENVYMFLGQACLMAKDYEHGIKSMAEGMVLYPMNVSIPTIGLQCCVDSKRGDNIQFFLDKALVLKPNDEQLLNIQGLVYEDRQDYKAAVEVYQKLAGLRPNSLSVNKHLALNYFNLGVNYYNDAIMQEEEKAAKRSKRQSNAYFQEAIVKLEDILASDPLSVKYMKALAVTYGCTGDTEKFEETNNRLRALGQQPERAAMPSMVAFNEDNSSNFNNSAGAGAKVGSVPPFSEFGKGYVTDGLAKWAQRGSFEKTDAYTARVNDVNAQAEYERLCREAEGEYIKQYGKQLRITDMKLASYDADNESYLITSDYGNIVLPVPMKNHEAEVFSSSWSKVVMRAPKFYIKNDRPELASITFAFPNGKSYTYDASDAAVYAYTDVKVDFAAIIDTTAGTTLGSGGAAVGSRVKKVTLESDVDRDIPIVKKPNQNAVALIIANENYANVGNVASAIHDGEVLAEYCRKTLGIPSQRVKLHTDASLGGMLSALADAKRTVAALDGDVDLIVYYAGHGMPDEATKDAYLIPTDGNATVPETCYSLDRFYRTLQDMGARTTSVFMDACFSGAQRGDGMLVAARGVAMKPKTTQPKGNMFVLSAASGQETAMPYREKNHGLFTYYLLKKLQQSKGNATLKEISDYVSKQVKEQSVSVNKKPQNPSVMLSGDMDVLYKSQKLR